VFETFINKLKKSALSDDAKNLIAAFGVMEHADKGLAAEVAEYILIGESESCITRISNLEEAFGDYSPGQLIMLKPHEKYSEQNERIFQSIPLLLSSATIQNPNILHRLSLVINTCVGDHEFHDMQTEIKGWFGNMLNLFNEYSARCKGDSRYRIQCPDRSTLLDLANQFGVPEDVVDAFILEGGLGGYRNTGVFIPYLRQTTDWLNLLKSPTYQKKVPLMKPSARTALCYQLKETKNTLPSYVVPVTVQLLADKSKDVRKAAAGFLGRVPAREIVAYLTSNYFTEKSDARKRWVSLAFDLPDGEQILQQWLKSEGVSSVAELIKGKLVQLESKKQSNPIHSGPIPEYKPDTRPPAGWNKLIRQSLDKMISDEQSNISRLTEKVNRLSQVLSEHPVQDELANRKSERQAYEIVQWDCYQAEKRLSKYININDKDIERYLVFIEHGGDVFEDDSIADAARRSGVYDDDSINFLQNIRQLWCLGYGRGSSYGEVKFDHLLEKDITDFRQLVLIYRQHHQDESGIINSILDNGSIASKLPFSYEKVSVWQFFSDNPEYIDNGLKGILEENGYYDESEVISRTLFLLGLFPSITRNWEIQLYQYALGSNKIHQKLAQNIAEKLGLKIQYLFDGLSSGNKECRTVAAKWLGKLKYQPAAEPLYKSLKKEKDLTVKAVFLDALENIGEDISDFVTKHRLLSEAEEGLKRSISSALQQFPRQEIPDLYYQDKSKVPSELIFWWFVLAVKLKQPEGNNLLQRYSGLLDEESRNKLGLFLFSAFISMDTQTALSGSAIKEKGMLGLIPALDGNTVLALLKPYMKKHYLRRAQIEVMLLVISRFDDDVIIQFLMATAQRYRTESIQEFALSLVENIAQKRGWSQQELAELTIPSAGLDKVDQATVFDYGQRQLSLTLTKDIKLQLSNEKQEVIKALPQPRLDDDKTELKETKKWFTACKKELKQTIEQQRNRLFEAMISDQRWSMLDWQQRLYAHPVMNRLLQYVLWQFKGDDGWISFHVDENGELTSLSGERLFARDDVQVRVLSANQISEEECSLWRAYLKKQKTKPLFEQLNQAETDIEPDKKRLDQFYGYVTDSFSLSNVMEKLGYKRGYFDDDKSRFFEYYKGFDSLGITAVLEFSGSFFPMFEEPVAIFSIEFVYHDSRKPYPRDSRTAYIEDIPENLLNAIALDYNAVAAKCQYDADWQDKLF
jgi:hypothetical protein